MATDVLLIDGHRETRQLLRYVLEANGYRVSECSDSLEGLRLARESTPDVIVTEFLVPSVGGACIAEQLREDPQTAGIPTVVFTARVFPEVRERVERAGAAFLPKPSSPSIVLGVIKGTLEVRDERTL